MIIIWILIVALDCWLLYQFEPKVKNKVNATVSGIRCRIKSMFH